jgi:uncharacterized protein YaiI (UPF0178 family)
MTIEFNTVCADCGADLNCEMGGRKNDTLQIPLCAVCIDKKEDAAREEGRRERDEEVEALYAELEQFKDQFRTAINAAKEAIAEKEREDAQLSAP